jgi:hypothetical protein
VRDSPRFDPAQFVQPDPAQPVDNWQVAYDERALNASGDMGFPRMEPTCSGTTPRSARWASARLPAIGY